MPRLEGDHDIIMVEDLTQPDRPFGEPVQVFVELSLDQAERPAMDESYQVDN